ncbi:DNA-directed RNA polymerase sigma-70 factor [Longispora fulva]|uniref:RNA polymerase sigma-70 factor (Sigma-E family) n=1 Tax=Longispora fulva TaxID=619741 RepID=A0A8J7GFD2_9ACTN|nr:SigE family RNA polymerase sigma factor [Longispora fulva]MBG6139653.1 RNA polymerase sigma-70 factor (sigma-E family) [Longispora fulva]GIG57965.1 DNA-directed RNA polymerase sigma-70 factor [Longispora fulva]
MEPAAEAEFTDFVAERGPALLRIAYALAGNQAAAEDLLQTALAKTALKWRSLDRRGVESYVKQVMYNDHVSWWRRRRNRQETSMASLPETPLPDSSEETALKLLLRDALRRLPPRQRAVLVLRYLEDLTEYQVAQRLGCSPGTVASQASRALRKLRATLEEYR